MAMSNYERAVRRTDRVLAQINEWLTFEATTPDTGTTSMNVDAMRRAQRCVLETRDFLIAHPWPRKR